MNKSILILVIAVLIFSCDEDDQTCSLESMCEMEQDMLSNAEFYGNIFFCNAQPNQMITQGTASLNLVDNQGQLRLVSDPTGFIDTLFLVTYDCNSTPECLFSAGDFFDENGNKVASFEGGNTPVFSFESIPYNGCSINYSGGIK